MPRAEGQFTLGRRGAASQVGELASWFVQDNVGGGVGLIVFGGLFLLHSVARIKQLPGVRRHQWLFYGRPARERPRLDERVLDWVFVAVGVTLIIAGAIVL